MPRGRGRGGRGGRRHGGGSGGGFGRGRYWAQPVPDEDESIQRPPGLKGKEIGMFYKNLSKTAQAKAARARLEASLAIPPVVFKQVGDLIKNIKETANRKNIKVNYVSRQKKFELLSRIKMEQESVMELNDTDGDDDVLINEVTPEVLVIESDEKDLKAEPLSANIKVETMTNTAAAQEDYPCTSKSSHAEEAMLMDLANKASTSDIPPIFNTAITKQEKDVHMSEQKTSFQQPFKSPAEIFLNNKKQELLRKQIELNKQDESNLQPDISPTAEYLAKKKQDLVRRQQAHKSSWNHCLAPVTDYNALRDDVAARVNQQAKPHFKGSEDFISFSNPSQPEQIKEQPVTQHKEIEFIPFSVQPGISGVHNMPNFIPVKQESHTLVKQEISSSDGPERILSLREKHDFKYSYHDIITGTFNEKLDEDLAKGITINRHSEEIQYLSEKYYTEYQDMIQERKYKEMLKFREKLPTYYKARELLQVINNNSVIVISGETGCGKSTQVPQLILDEAILNKRGANIKILVTQPRRIAASSLAERVATERAESMGSSVGYAVRLERQDSRPRGSIMYVTTGILLTELEVNQGLTNFSHIILDEVHERDTHVDLSMMVLKEILKKRKDLKVILMSATLNAEALSGYFDNCPVMHIEGLAYPVQDIYLEEIYKLINYTFEDLPPSNQPKTGNRHGRNDSQSRLMERDIQHRARVAPWIESIKTEIDRDLYKVLLDSRSEVLNLDVILKLLIYLIKSPPGAVLVFLPGIGEISKLLRSMELSNAFPNSNFEIYPLHSKLPSLEQRKIFERPPDHIRKIIIATNIAETSITIDDVVYVIDCGKVKLSGLNVEDNIETLQTEWASKANLHQRRGRAGRCQPGICYHLVTSHRASQLDERLLPELQRSNLLEAVLMTKRLRLGRAEEAFQRVLDPPDVKTVKWAVKHLQQIGCLDEEETLTPLGWHLARLPVHPAAGKLMLLAALFGCLDRAASVAAVWGFKDPFLMVIGRESQTDETKAAFALDEPSDHVALSEAIIAWERTSTRDRRSFCYDNFLSNNTLALLTEMKKQFGNNLKQMGFLPTGDIKAQWENRNANNLSLFKAIVAAALYPNVARIKWNALRARNQHKPLTITACTTEDGRVSLHPSSVCAPRHNQHRTSRYNYQPVPLKRWQQRDKPGAGWLVYWLKQKSTALFLIEVTLVYTLPLMFFGELEVTYDETCPDDCFLWISTHGVRCDMATADLLFELRSLLDHVLASKVGVSSAHAVSHSEFDDQVLNAVIELITAEDEQVESMEECVSDSDFEYESKGNQRNWRMRN